MTNTAVESSTQSVLSALGSRFLDTFVRSTPEPLVAWDLAPRWPKVLYRFLHSDVAPWLGLIAVFAIAARSASHLWGWAAAIGGLAVLPLAIAGHDVLMGWRVALGLALGAAVVWAEQPVAVVAVIELTVFTVYVGLSFQREISLWAWAATAPVVTFLLDGPLGATLPVMALLALLTDTLRSRRLASIALADQREITGVERARRIGVEERARVARELHDIVAHHMSMVAVRAETAPFRLPELAEPVKNEFAEISEAARESLNEIRGLLAVLRSDEAPRVPQPGIAQIEELVEGTRRAGVDVELTIRGEPRHLRSAVEVCAYRILQESLANVSRHAPGHPVEIWVEYGDDALEVMVANPTEGTVGEPGHGITGMTERAAAVGGTVGARRRADGRFVVEASLPYER